MGRALAGVLLLLGLPARAEGVREPRAPALVSFKRTLCIYTGCFLEPLVPDLRREWGGGARWVLSWPVHPYATRPWDAPGPFTLQASPWVEPQLRTGPARWSLAGGARVYAFPDRFLLGVLVDGGWKVGEGRPGPLAAVGVAYDLVERHGATLPWTVALVARRTWPRGGPGVTDLSLDVTVPLNQLWGTRRPASPRDH